MSVEAQLKQAILRLPDIVGEVENVAYFVQHLKDHSTRIHYLSLPVLCQDLPWWVLNKETIKILQQRVLNTHMN